LFNHVKTIKTTPIRRKPIMVFLSIYEFMIMIYTYKKSYDL